MPVLDWLAALGRYFDETFTFDPTATTVSTPLTEVWASKRGVCQDFTHVLLSCLRQHGLPAAYVSGYLLTAPPDPLPIATIDDLFRAHRARASSLWAGAAPFDRAVALALSVDRVGYAFAGGYHAALRALAPSVPEDRVVAFCATEDEGAHPRAIRTSLAKAPGGGFSLTGRKRWATLARSAPRWSA